MPHADVSLSACWRCAGGARGRVTAPLLPLDVLLEIMRRKWAEGDYDAAAKLARDAAPYLHARASGARSSDLRAMSDDELDREIHHD